MTFNAFHKPAAPAPAYDAQVLYVHTNRCLNCQAINTTSRLFACDALATGNGKKLYPASQFVDYLPLQILPAIINTTAICHLCADSIQPAIDREAQRIRWEETLARKRQQLRAEQHAGAQARPTSPKAPRAEPTLDDLI
jgi:hypothetical protein